MNRWKSERYPDAPMDGLTARVVAMADDEFNRALAAALRFWRRNKGREAPRGGFDREGVWQPHPEEAACIPPEQRNDARANDIHLFVVCKTLAHCVQLEDAEYYATVWVKHWLDQIHLTHNYTPDRAAALRSSLKLELAIDNCTPTQTPRRMRL